MVATAMGKRLGGGGDNPTDLFHFEFHSRDFPVPADVQAYAHDKLAAKMAKHSGRLLEVIVHFKDVNGSKGGEDKQCHLEAVLAGLEPVNVQEQHHDVRAALDLAIDALEVAVGRTLDRARKVPIERGRKEVRNKKLASP